MRTLAREYSSLRPLRLGEKISRNKHLREKALAKALRTLR